MNIEKELDKVQKEIYNIENKIEISQNKKISSNKSLYDKLNKLYERQAELEKMKYQQKGVKASIEKYLPFLHMKLKIIDTYGDFDDRIIDTMDFEVLAECIMLKKNSKINKATENKRLRAKALFDCLLNDKPLIMFDGKETTILENKINGFIIKKVVDK